MGCHQQLTLHET
jgi:hypothetical protein